MLSKLSKRKIPAIVGVVICLIAVIVAKNTLLREKTIIPPPLVKTMVVAEASDSSEYNYPGEVHSQYESQLAFQVGGKILKKFVEVGDVVKEGDILLMINPQDVAQTATINLAAVESARSKSQLSKVNFERISQLYQQGAVSQVEYDTSQNTYDTASATLAQAEAAYSQSTNQLDYCNLRADKSGVIANVDVEEGQVVTPGQKVVSIVQNTSLEVDIDVPENKVDTIKDAKNITISFWALPDCEEVGTISEISPIADSTSRTYEAKISLINPSPDIHVGMSATVNINPNIGNKNIYIPLEAVYQTSSSPSVWVVKNHKACLQQVKVTKFSGNNVEVTKGLKPGDTIIIAGVHKLSQGEQVRTERDSQ